MSLSSPIPEKRPNGKRPSRFWSVPRNRIVVNTNVLAIVFVSVLVCTIVGATVTPQAETASQSATTEPTPQPTAEPAPQPTAGESLGGDISAFMQRGGAAANGSVDSGTWLAAFETAENQSRKEALVSQRTETLNVRLAALETRIQDFSPNETNRTVAHRARWARLAADSEALRTSISDARTAAASEGVNATELDRLSRQAENLSVPNATSSENPRAANTATDATNAVASRDPLTDSSLSTGTTYRGP